jgi:aspartate kinase
LPLIVQKYGGSSLATPDLIKNVADKIAKSHNNTTQIVVTVSAMGGSTDDLLNIASKIALRPDSRELDVLLSTGESQACALLSMALKSIGKNAISLSGSQAGIITDANYGKAKISRINHDRIKKELQNGFIVIVAGFQGVTDYQDITTLGRGASDLTAVALAASLKADRCEIYTDVDGIYTADPRLVANATKIKEIGFEEMLELANYGAKMNPRSIELGMAYQVPIIVSNSTNEEPGTLIHEVNDMESSIGEIRNRVRGIATEKNVVKITILSVVDRPGIAASLFEPLAIEDISVDIIVQNYSVDGSTDLTFTVTKEDSVRAIDVVEKISLDLGNGKISKTIGLAKVSIVGTGMQNTPGYAATMFSSLANAGINIEMITTSEIRITCVIREKDMEKAAQSLHNAFELD